MEKTIEFEIGFVQYSNNRITIQGVCYEATIHLGDVFTRVYRIEIQKIPEGYGPSKRIEIGAVSLQVSRIRSYNKELEFMSRGMTGELELIGETSVPLEPKQVLGIEHG